MVQNKKILLEKCYKKIEDICQKGEALSHSLNKNIQLFNYLIKK